jgi:hypothetical protein
MEGIKKELWMQLCERAAVEQDPKKLVELVKRIDALLQEKQERLNRSEPKI